MGNQVKLIAAGVAFAETLPGARRCHRKRSLARAADGAAAGIALASAFEVVAPTVVVNDLHNIDTFLELRKVHLANSAHENTSFHFLPVSIRQIIKLGT